MRNDLIDRFRGAGIILVLVGHAVTPQEPLWRFIYAFHMPAFFILSGFLFNPEKAANIAAYARSRFFRLIVPAWLWGLFCAAVHGPKVFAADPADFFSRLVGTLSGFPGVAWSLQSTPIWFLFALFLVEMFGSICVVLFGRHFRLALLALGLIGAGITFFQAYSPFNFLIALTACLFFVAGSYLRKFTAPDALDTLVSSWRGPILGALAAAVVIGNVLTLPDGIRMAGNHLGDTPNQLVINVVTSLFGTYALLAFAKLTPGSFVAWWGRHTIPVLALNYLVQFDYVNRLTRKLQIENWLVTVALDMLVIGCVIVLLQKIGPLGKALEGGWEPKRRSSSKLADQSNA